MAQYILIVFYTLVNFLFFSINLKGEELERLEDDSVSFSVNKKRLTKVIAGEATIYSALIYNLNNQWYKDYPRSKFHLFNDNKEWLQMDKLGHTFSAYQLGRFGAEMLRNCNVDEKKVLVFGATLGWFFLGSVELLDGRSEKWGFSFGDIIANSFGSIMYIGQELFWKEQKAEIKISYSNSGYSTFRPTVLGKNFQEKVLKDYNAQTYWLSCNLHSIGIKKAPPWLCFSIGYGADGMLGAFFNPTLNSDGTILPAFSRSRQYYVSMDIDLRKIRSKNKFANNCLGLISFIKIPFPTIEINNSTLKFHPIYF